MTDHLDPHLEPLRTLLGRTFRGEMPDDGRVAIDISRWERALGGRAVRNLHSVDEGEYGGETIIFWDEDAQAVGAWYFTTAGFRTRATLTFEPGRVVSHERVTGNKNGITEVRGVTEIRPDGTLHTRAEYLKNGEWVPGHSGVYREDPSAEVRFR